MDGRISGRADALAGWLLLAAACAGTAQAADAHQAVTPKPGEMVLLRDVSTRPAYRMSPPGMALIVDPSPRREVASALGIGGMDELDDADYAAMQSGLVDATPAATHGQNSVERVAGGMVGGTLGRVTGEGGMLSGGQMARMVGGPLGAVGGATRGIGDQLRGALAQFPQMQPATTGGP